MPANSLVAAQGAAPSAPVKARKQHGESPCRGKPRPRSRR